MEERLLSWIWSFHSSAAFVRMKDEQAVLLIGGNLRIYQYNTFKLKKNVTDPSSPPSVY